MARTKPTSVVKQRRKHQLRVRDGKHCAYCLSPFPHLSDATIDHVAPYSLLRTWSVGALVLACADCNHRKADRLPLSIALLVLRSADPIRPVVPPAVLPLLARLAHANRPTRPAPESTGRDTQRSMADLRESTPHYPIPERTAA